MVPNSVRMDAATRCWNGRQWFIYALEMRHMHWLELLSDELLHDLNDRWATTGVDLAVEGLAFVRFEQSYYDMLDRMVSWVTRELGIHPLDAVSLLVDMNYDLRSFDEQIAEMVLGVAA